MAKMYYVLVTAVAGAAILALEVWGAGPSPRAGQRAGKLGRPAGHRPGQALAAGSLLGGRLSRGREPERADRLALAIAAVYLAALSQLYNSMLRWTATQPLPVGEILAALMVQGLPMVALGTITPLALRLAARGPQDGRAWCSRPEAAVVW